MPPITPQNSIPQTPIVEPNQQRLPLDNSNDLMTLPDFTPRQGSSLDIARDTFDQLITLIESREQEPQNQLGSNHAKFMSVSPERHYPSGFSQFNLTPDDTDGLTGASSFRLVVGYNFGADDTIRVKVEKIQPK